MIHGKSMGYLNVCVWNIFHNLFCQVKHLKEICVVLSIPASSPQRGFVPHRWLSAYDASMATYAMMPAYKILYYGFLTPEDKELYKEPLTLIYTNFRVNQAARARIKLIQEELNQKGDNIWY